MTDSPEGKQIEEGSGITVDNEIAVLIKDEIQKLENQSGSSLEEKNIAFWNGFAEIYKVLSNTGSLFTDTNEIDPTQVNKISSSFLTLLNNFVKVCNNGNYTYVEPLDELSDTGYFTITSFNHADQIDTLEKKLYGGNEPIKIFEANLIVHLLCYLAGIYNPMPAPETSFQLDETELNNAVKTIQLNLMLKLSK